MERVMIRYQVKPDAAVENETLVRRVYEELHQSAPADIRYATFVLDDGVSFVHVAESDGSPERNPLLQLAAFRDFQAGIAERCVEPPTRATVREVGSYGFWERREGA